MCERELVCVRERACVCVRESLCVCGEVYCVFGVKFDGSEYMCGGLMVLSMLMVLISNDGSEYMRWF